MERGGKRHEQKSESVDVAMLADIAEVTVSNR